MTATPDFFQHVLVKMMTGQSREADLRIARALDAAIAWGMARALEGQTDGLTRDQLLAVFLEKAGGL